MGEGQESKEQNLSGEEKAYLKELARREEARSKNLEDRASAKELEGSSTSKEAREMANELKKLQQELKAADSRAEIIQTQEKLKEISKKFLKTEKTMKRKEQFSEERKSETGRQYILRSVNEPEPEPVKKELPALVDGLSESQKVFFYRYIENLEQSHQ